MTGTTHDCQAEGNPFADDLEVLAHLRGYPEEFTRFANLMKQAHPRGKTALAVVLGRPAAEDSLVTAVCRNVAQGVPVLNAVEIAELWGLPPGRFLDEVASRPGFPAPLFAQEHRRLWRRQEVEAYRAAGGAAQDVAPGGQAGECPAEDGPAGKPSCGASRPGEA